MFADLDGDGDYDVVSSCEGRTRTLYFHWTPASGSKAKSANWQTQALPVTAGKQSWMFALPLQIDDGGVDLVLGSKGGGASIGWLRSPKNPRDVEAWRFHRWYDAGWIMSLIAHDMDALMYLYKRIGMGVVPISNLAKIVASLVNVIE